MADHGIRVEVNPDCPPDTIYLINEDYVIEIPMEPIKVVDHGWDCVACVKLGRHYAGQVIGQSRLEFLWALYHEEARSLGQL